MKNQTRLALHVDVFDATQQQALALPHLTPFEFIRAVLHEFEEYEYLSDQPEDYLLRRAIDGSCLDHDSQLDQQLEDQAHLVLVERELSLPEGTRRPSKHLYLREENTSQVYKLHWVPAIIGRVDKNQPYNDWVAVNLETLETGLRVSRRHVKITEEGDQFYIENMADNPIKLVTVIGETTPIGSERQLLQDGEVIRFERSGIRLKFMIRSG